ncbi:K02A2.6-like, partial [Cordylochernes scorpioides]
MRKLREAIGQKRPDLWKNKNWLLHHDNACSHIVACARPFGQKQHTNDAAATVFPRSGPLRFVKNLSCKAKPMEDLWKNDAKFCWHKEQENDFEILKEALTSEPVLENFIEDTETHIHTDASGYGIGAVLIQIQGGLKDPSVRLDRWAIRLQEFDIIVVYKIGRKHKNARLFIK